MYSFYQLINQFIDFQQATAVAYRF